MLFKDRYNNNFDEDGKKKMIIAVVVLYSLLIIFHIKLIHVNYGLTSRYTVNIKMLNNSVFGYLLIYKNIFVTICGMLSFSYGRGWSFFLKIFSKKPETTKELQVNVYKKNIMGGDMTPSPPSALVSMPLVTMEINVYSLQHF